MNEANNRELFGGGRYDELMNLFGGESMPACGFGMGDVTIRDFLETRNLLPAYKPAASVMVCIMEDSTGTAKPYAESIAKELRDNGVNVAMNYSEKSTGDQIKAAEKLSIPNVIIIGENEAASKSYEIKNLASGEKAPVPNIEFVKDFVARV